ncbi:MAG: tripartite tricarboxylate transporter permease [bacterium]|jgi:putative tricarboxylic transport membrane protein
MVGEVLEGFLFIFTTRVFFYLLGGLLMGVFFGCVPGLTATLAIALLLPFTFTMDVVPALVTIMGVYAGGIYGGCITATTINIPGAPASTMTMLEGYPMMQRGEGAKAIGYASVASGIGGIVGAVVLMFLAPQMAKVALTFRSPERFTLILLSVVIVAMVTRGSLVKGIIATLIGLIISTIGMDPLLPYARFNFGNPYLSRGIGLLPAIVGLFALPELLRQMEAKDWNMEVNVKVRVKDVIPPWSELRKIGPLLYLKSAIIGVIVGILPGSGAAMAAFVAYAEAKRTSKQAEKYGTGIPEGIVAAETANNAVCGGALIPLLSLGIPGDSVTAIVFGVLLIQGLIPGPRLVEENLSAMATMFAGLFIAQMIIPLIGFLLTPIYLRLISINRSVLFAFIGVISIVGIYVAEFSVFQMGVTVVVGVLAYFLQRFGYPTVPILMGIILGPLLEEYFRRSISLGGMRIFISTPLSVALLALTVLAIYYLGFKQSWAKKMAEE